MDISYNFKYNFTQYNSKKLNHFTLKLKNFRQIYVKNRIISSRILPFVSINRKSNVLAVDFSQLQTPTATTHDSTIANCKASS